MSEQDGSKSGEGAPEGAGAPDSGEAPKEEAREGQQPADAFRQGLGLLWQAARGAADEIKREVDKAALGDAIRSAGREIEHAASAAAKELEGIIARVQPVPPFGNQWPPPPKGEAPKGEAPDEGKSATEGEPGERASAEPAAAPEDGGTDEEGERRDMRIQVDDD